MPKFIVVIDSFKGCLSSKEANVAVAEGIRSKLPDAQIIQIPVSDGGEGFLDAFYAVLGGDWVDILVNDPLMRPVNAQYLIKDTTAVIEMARASGLNLLLPAERNPMIATTYGTGQLVADAICRGCKNVIVGLGGSATSDAGMGMLQALIDIFSNDGTWQNIRQLEGVRFTIATDVANPLCGEGGAAHVFAPQKGATPEMVIKLDDRARRFARQSAQLLGYDRQNAPGAGAAGGLGYAFLQYLNAERRSGIDLLLDAVRFNDELKDASLVITGEGKADAQTLMGKLPYGILQRSKANKVPVLLIAGQITDKKQLLDAGFSSVVCINPPDLPLKDALNPKIAKRNIRKTMATTIDTMRYGTSEICMENTQNGC